MSLGWKALLRVVCASALAAAMVAMPASAAKKVRHSGAVAQRVAPASSVRSATPGRTKNNRHAESRSAERHSHARDGHDRRHAGRDDGRRPTRESSRNHSRHGLSASQDRRERRQSRRPRYRSRKNYGYQSDFSGSDFAYKITSDVKSKPGYPHGYTPRATDIAMTAMSLIGTPYRYGGNSPLTGLDCSGFVKYVYKETLDTDLPRTAAAMSRVGQPVSREDLKPGDLVFYNTMRRSNSHVGIYLGDGRFIHSPRTGQRVRINSMDESYWRGRFNGARRILGGQSIDRAKALEEYSRQADTSPDTYNYDEDEPSSQRPARAHAQRKDIQQPVVVAEAQPKVTAQPSASVNLERAAADRSSSELRRESHNRYHRRHHSHRAERQEYSAQRRQEAVSEEARHRGRRSAHAEGHDSSRRNLRQVERHGDDRGRSRSTGGGHEAKAARDARRQGNHSVSRQPERSRAFMSIERKPSPRHHSGRRH